MYPAGFILVRQAARKLAFLQHSLCSLRAGI
jgi:hypothetical protein